MGFRFLHTSTNLAKSRKYLHGYIFLSQNQRRYISCTDVYLSKNALGFPESLGWGRRKMWSSLPTEDTGVNWEKLMIIRETLVAQVCSPSLWIGYWLSPFAQPRIMCP